jgi:60 kDa SS-A/Ro ribonucleoprotein
MTGARVSAKSKVTNAEVAAVLGAIVTKKAAESVVIGFGETAKIIKVNPDDTMISNIEKIVRTDVGHSTNAGLAFRILTDNGIKVDRIVLVSDMQCYNTDRRSTVGSFGYLNWFKDSYVNEEWNKYLTLVNRKAYLYSLDVSSYGTRQTPNKSKGVILINGWSDKIIDYMNIAESDIMEQQIAKW